MRRWRAPVARAAAGLVILGLVLAGVDPGAVADRLARADLALAAVGVLGLTATHLMPAAGWRAILGTTNGVWLAWRSAVAVYYASQAIGGVTPANLGGDLHRAGTLRRSGHGWPAAVAPLLVQRATSYLALSILAAVALTFLASRTPLAGGMVVAGLAFAAAVGIGAWVLLAAPGPLGGWRDRLIGQGAAAPTSLGGATLIGMGQGLAFHAAAIGLTGLVVLAVEPTAPIGPVLAALAVARLALAVPLTPSGLGVQEGAAAVLFAGIGLAPGVALAAMLLARLSLLLTTAIGVTLLQRREALPSERTAADASAAR
jgi:uncharacterized membrane protein YbhN (UPF0104 family)